MSHMTNPLHDGGRILLRFSGDSFDRGLDDQRFSAQRELGTSRLFCYPEESVWDPQYAVPIQRQPSRFSRLNN